MKAPAAYVDWINRHLGFNPRSQANSNALSDFIVADLRRTCRMLDRALASGKLVARRNATVRTRVAGRSVDLVLNEQKALPTITVRVSTEHKSIMTAHAKARWNRYGDLIAYSNHMHNHRRDCIAAAVVVINVSKAYRNPDAFARRLKRPKTRMKKVVRDTLRIFADIPLRNRATEPNDQPEAIAVVLVDYDGIHPAKLVTRAPAPRPGNPTHYDTFVRRICRFYRRRFRKP